MSAPFENHGPCEYRPVGGAHRALPDPVAIIPDGLSNAGPGKKIQNEIKELTA
jgi:hypothetical protein